MRGVGCRCRRRSAMTAEVWSSVLSCSLSINWITTALGWGAGRGSREAQVEFLVGCSMLGVSICSLPGRSEVSQCASQHASVLAAPLPSPLIDHRSVVALCRSAAPQLVTRPSSGDSTMFRLLCTLSNLHRRCPSIYTPPLPVDTHSRRSA